MNSLHATVAEFVVPGGPVPKTIAAFYTTMNAFISNA